MLNISKVDRASISIYLKNHYRKVVIILLSLSILMMLWYLRTPLSQKYLIVKPKTYSTLTMDNKKRYLLSQGDFLQGKAIPNTKVKILLTPGKFKKTILVNSKGEWFFQIPQNTNLKKYVITAADFDKNNKLAFAKGYRIRIESNNKLFRTNMYQSLLNLFQTKKAKALDGGPGTDYDWQRLIGDDWADFIKLWNQSGICPAIDDNGEIIYLNKDVYDEIYGPNYTCPAFESLEAWQNELDSDKELFVQLYIKLNSDGWPEDSFIDYFPNWKEFLAQNRTVRIDSIPKAAYKHNGETIDADTLTSYIQDVAVRSGYREKIIWKLLLNREPLLNSRAMYNVVSSYKFTNNWDYVDAVLGILSLIPANAADRVAYKIAVEGFSAKESSKAVEIARQAVKDGSILSKEDFAPSLGLKGAKAGLKDSLWKLRPDLMPENLAAEIGNDEKALKIFQLIRAGKAAVADPEITRPILSELYNKLATHTNNLDNELVFKGLLPPIEELMKIVDQNHIIVVNSAEFAKLEGGGQVSKAGGFAINNLIVMSDSASTDLLPHEFIHVIAHLNMRNLTGRRFTYSQVQADKLSQLYSIIYEISTDDIVQLLYNKRGGYQDEYPVLYKAVRDLIERLNKDAGISRWEFGYFNDYYRFALTGDPAALDKALFPRTRPVENFLEILWNVDTDRLARLAVEQKEIDDRIKAWIFSLAYVGQQAQVYSNREYYYELLTGRDFSTDTAPVITFLSDPLGIKNDGTFFADNASTANPDTPDFFQISSVIGDFNPGSGLSVSAVISSGGESFDMNGYQVLWALEDTSSGRKSSVSQLSPLPGAQGPTDCSEYCTIVLPSDTTDGEYFLRAYLVKKGYDFILASDEFPMTISHLASTESGESAPSSSQPAGQSCEYQQWSDEYSCQNGYRCYNDWYSSQATSCQPQAKGPDASDDQAKQENNFHCDADPSCQSQDSQNQNNDF